MRSKTSSSPTTKKSTSVTPKNLASTPTILPPKPIAGGGPNERSSHRKLYEDVISALYALPARFHCSLVIEGVLVTDLHTMNTALGAAIEQSVVDSLNALRILWDPDNKYAKYSFVRQSQTFPDVLLRTSDPKAAEPILMGIELKGWFAVAKEAEPSARFYASEHACAESDLLVVIPWLFDSVVSGRPRLMKPIIAEAKYVAQVRNWWWEFVRESKESTVKRGIAPAPYRGVYPTKIHKYSDRAISDSGKNFGRVARCGVIDEEVKAVASELALGVPIAAWRKFLSAFSEKATPASVQKILGGIEADYLQHLAVTPACAVRVAEKLHEIGDILEEEAGVATKAITKKIAKTPKLKTKK